MLCLTEIQVRTANNVSLRRSYFAPFWCHTTIPKKQFRRYRRLPLARIHNRVIRMKKFLKGILIAILQ